MKKIIALTVLTCIFYSTTTFCMFKLAVQHVHKQRYLQSIRFYATKNPYEKLFIPQLPARNLFNTKPEASSPTQLKKFAVDLLKRNEQLQHGSEQETLHEQFKNCLSEEQETLVGQQNGIIGDLIIERTDTLDMPKLHALENALRKTFSRPLGHANE